jgi:hypothetical protein
MMFVPNREHKPPRPVTGIASLLFGAVSVMSVLSSQFNDYQLLLLDLYSPLLSPIAFLVFDPIHSQLDYLNRRWIHGKSSSYTQDNINTEEVLTQICLEWHSNT